MAQDEMVDPVDWCGVLTCIIVRGAGLGPDMTTVWSRSGLNRGLINGGPVNELHP